MSNDSGEDPVLGECLIELCREPYTKIVVLRRKGDSLVAQLYPCGHIVKFGESS